MGKGISKERVSIWVVALADSGMSQICIFDKLGSLNGKVGVDTVTWMGEQLSNHVVPYKRTSYLCDEGTLCKISHYLHEEGTSCTISHLG